ncbi:hypothetical protein NX059_012220 [Plenodomus lindquistii]|nr:hypothetical protein NX059_012220 [Plenodomus lindquistii]
MASTVILIVDEDLHLHRFRVSKHDTNAAIIARLRRLSFKDLSTMHDFSTQIKHTLLMREPTVGKGLVPQMSDPEAQIISPQHGFNIKKDDTLTRLLFGSIPTLDNGNLYAYLVDAAQDGHAEFTEV